MRTFLNKHAPPSYLGLSRNDLPVPTIIYTVHNNIHNIILCRGRCTDCSTDYIHTYTVIITIYIYSGTSGISLILFYGTAFFP